MVEIAVNRQALENKYCKIYTVCDNVSIMITFLFPVGLCRESYQKYN